MTLNEIVFELAEKTFTNYTHSMNTASYSVIFGLMAGFDDSEILALGGLLHDIGLSELSIKTVGVDQKSFSSCEWEEYKSHPIKAIDILNRKSIPLSELVKEMILQHHENPDGSGYPYGLEKDAISPYAKILSLADYFDEQTSSRPNEELFAPIDVFNKLLQQKEVPAFYDHEFHGNLIKTLITNELPSDEAESSGAYSHEGMLKKIPA